MKHEQITNAEIQEIHPLGDIYTEYLKQVKDVFYDQVRVADQKAAYVFTFILALMITSDETRAAFSWDVFKTGDVLSIVISMVLAASLTVTIVSAVMVVLPRRSSWSSSLYWGGWPVHRRDIEIALAANDTGFIKREYLSTIDSLSEIARSKYRFVGFAFRGLLVAVLSYVALLVVVV